MKKMVKRTSCIWMCILYCLLLSGLLTHHAFAEYPEIKIDPSTGYPYDFGGETIYIYDYWTSDTERKPNPTEKEQALYDYQDWIQSTYNCKVEQIAKGDWGSNADELIRFFSNSNVSQLCLFIIPSDFVGKVLQANAAAAWNLYNSTIIEGEKWNQSSMELMAQDGLVYGVSTGYSEPRQCLYFNKRVLEEAGVDWNSIYDMQAEGTWTWSAFETILHQIQKDLDNDGILDIYGLTGSNVDLFRIAVFSNGGSFFDYSDEGKLSVNANSDNSLEALNWAKRIWNSYGYRQSADDSWDYYKDAWKQGFCGFYIYQAYGGFNKNSEMSDMVDEWGCVAFPIGPKGQTYVTIVSDNITVIPNVYDQETTNRIAFIYDLWTNTPTSYDDDKIASLYNYTDERAVNETYSMLRKSEHCVIDRAILIGSLNDIEGEDFLWNLEGNEVDELIENKLKIWEKDCNTYTSNLTGPYTTYRWSNDYDTLTATLFKRDRTIIASETIEEISKETVSPTCEGKGLFIYQSGEFNDDRFHPQSITVEYSEALGHDWGDWDLIWSEEDQSVMFACVCKRDVTHIEVSEVFNTLVLPDQIQVIEEEAFSELISAHAVYIPNSVSFIAANAFENSNMIIAAPEGSYALEWAQEKGFEYIAVRTTDQ